jgi:hypothetical protein
MNEIIQATTVQERVKTKVQELFVGLISEEEWSKLIKKEIDAFISPPDADRWGNSNKKTSAFQDIIQQELKDRFKSMLKTELDRPEYAGMWHYGTNGQSVICPGVVIEQILKNSIPEIINAMFGQFMQSNVDSLKYMLEQKNSG